MGWLDVAVSALLAVFGLGLAVVILVEGGSVVEAGLALLLFAAVAFRFWYQSFAGETLADRRRRRSSPRD